MPESHLLLLIIGVLYGLFIVICGFWLIKPPKNINHTYGYRTPRSMKTIAHWNYANKLAPKLMLTTAHISLLLSLIVYYFFLTSNISFTVAFSLTSCLFGFLPILVIPVVEYRLKKQFPAIK